MGVWWVCRLLLAYVRVSFDFASANIRFHNNIKQHSPLLKQSDRSSDCNTVSLSIHTPDVIPEFLLALCTYEFSLEALYVVLVLRLACALFKH